MALAAGVLLFAGCNVVVYDVEVRAANLTATPPVGTYQLVNPRPEPEAQKGFAEAAPFIRRALAAKGLREAASGEKPTWKVELYSGVTARGNYAYLTSAPVYSPVTYSFPSTTIPLANGATMPARRTEATQTVSGYVPAIGVAELFTKYVFLRGYAADAPPPAQGDARAAWAVEAAATDRYQTCTEYLPALTAASALSLGKNIKKIEILSLYGSEGNMKTLPPKSGE